MPTPLVSIIVPLYNAAATVEETVRSVLAQTSRDWECVVVDDGSTDTGPSIVQGLTAGDDRFRLVSQPNRGLAGARNTGLSHARGRYVQFLDSDDRLAPSSVAVLTAAAESSRRGAAAGCWDLIDEAGRPIGRTMSIPAQTLTIDGLLGGNRIAPHSHIVRRDWFDSGRFDETLRVVEDLDLWLRLAERGLEWQPVNSVVASYRIRPGSLSKNPALMFQTHCAVLAASYRRLSGGSHAKVDASPTRLQRALRSTALFYSAIAALQGSIATALDLAGPHSDALSIPIAPDELGVAAAWGLTFGSGIGPAALTGSARDWLPRFVEWCQRCSTAHARGKERPTLDAALRALTSTMIDADAVADRILDDLPDCTAIILAGLGQNGRALERGAVQRRIRLEFRDDHIAGALPLSAPFPANSTIIVTPLNDAAILGRLPTAAGIIRWTAVRDRLASSLYERLMPLVARYAAASGNSTRPTPSVASR